MKEIMLIGTYIKRSANLYFLGQEYEFLPQQEIRLTFDEAVRALNACGMECGVAYQMTRPMADIRGYTSVRIVKNCSGNDKRRIILSFSLSCGQ